MIGEWLRRLWYLLNRRRFDAALAEEMDAHRSAMPAPGRFGNTLRLREDAQDVWGWRWLDNLGRDVRLAGRTLRRTPGFTIVSVLSLGVGFALAASTVAVVNAYLLRSLPYPNAARLYHVRYAPPGPWEPRGMSSLDWTSVDDVVLFPVTASGDTFYLTDAGYAQSVRALRVTRGFVQGLGVQVVAGRTFGDADFVRGAEQPALIGHAVWRDRYGSDPGIVGRQLQADSEGSGGATETFRVVGVLPPNFYFGRDSTATIDVLLPLTSTVRTYMVRLREGVSEEQAERRITDAARRVASDLPANWTGVHLDSAHGRYVDELRPVLLGMTIAAALVLAIVCANVAVLLVLRTLRRQKELAVRAALGLARLQLVRMLAVESAIVCAASLGLGLLMTRVVLGLVGPAIETQIGRPAPAGAGAIGIDGTVLLLVAALGVIVAVALSLLPLAAPWQRRLAEALRRDGSTTADGRAMHRLRSGLIACEVAGTLVLFVGCGLLIRSVIGMTRTDLGFDVDRLARAGIVLRGADYPDAAAFFRFYEQFTDRVSVATRAPVVSSSWPPFNELPTQAIEVDGREGGHTSAGVVTVGAGYFATLGVPLRQGRDFTRADVAGAEPVAVISETLAARLWPEGGAVGRRVRGVAETPEGLTPGPWRTVVGVAADVRQTYGDRQTADFYVPQSPMSFGRFGSFYLRTDRSMTALLETLRDVAAGLDPHAVIRLPPRTVASEDRQLAGTAFLSSMVTVFAAIAGFLAILGIYGVTAYGVQQREREVAIRMALGASGAAVVRLFVKEGSVVLGAGLLLGLIGAATATSVLEHQLFGVRRFDPVTLIATCLLVAAAGLAACWWPARRASSKNPTTALKA